MSNLRRETRERLAELYNITQDESKVAAEIRECASNPLIPFPVTNSTLSVSEFREAFFKYVKKLGYIDNQLNLEKKIISLLTDEEEETKKIITRDNFANFPEVGEEQQIYYDIESEQAYIWSTDEYVPLSSIDGSKLVSIECGDATKNI